MTILDNLKMYWRFAWGLRSYVRRTLTLEEARDIIKRRMAQREESFLRIAKRAVFEYPQSPYLPLMKLAGCEYGDIENQLRTQGLEKTLRDLREAGVYVSYEELKGRKPIVQGSQSFKVSTNDFESPFLKGQYYAESGGTTGVGRRMPLELDHMAEQAPQIMLARHAHDCLDAPTALWRGPIPDGSGINHMIRATRFGRVPQKWFTAHLTGRAKPRLFYRLVTTIFIHAMRSFSVPVPSPQALTLDQAIVVARWAQDSIKRHGSCCILAPAGRALRVSLAAQEAGMDLTGLTFMVGGEPFTTAKAQAISKSGARCLPNYAMFELGMIGLGCLKPRCSDDPHLVRDCYALITHPLQVSGGVKVQALNITSLLPTAPLIMLNAQIDDHALVDQHPCGCPLQDLGYHQHIRKISSYSKLVTEGVSFIGSDVVKVLEEVLPRRFGGSPLDYQLIEKETPNGITQVNLLVSPRLDIPDEENLKSVFLSALKKGPDSYSWARSLWSQGQTLQVHRRAPFATQRGKHLTLWRNRNEQTL